MYVPPLSYQVHTLPPYVVEEEGTAIKGERIIGTTTTTTMMTNKTKRTKKRYNTDLCINPYQTLRCSTDVGRVS